MKLVLIDPADDGLEVKNVVRHVRTPEGQRRFGQPIGSVITRDAINRDRRKRGLKPLPGGSGGGSGGGGSSSDKKPSGSAGGGDKTPARKPKLSVQDSGPKAPARSGGDKPGAPMGKAVLTGRGRPDGAGTEQDPIDVKGDIDRAAQLLGEGKHIRLNRPEEASTLIKKLHDVVGDMRAQGKDAPSYDLCKVSVPNTNLFCARHKGVSRAEMPQVAGLPTPGSKAEKIARERGTASNGKVDLAPEFRKALADAGVGVQQKSVRASRLHASQMELDAETVAAIPDAIRSGAIPKGARIAVTRDGYILDGHHRWAAKVYEDIEDGQLGDLSIDADVLDMDIGAAIDFARRFARDMGIGAEEGPNAPGEANGPSKPNLTPTQDSVLREIDRRGGVVNGYAGQPGLNVHTLRALTRAGYLQTPKDDRQIDPNERNYNPVELTDKGREYLRGPNGEKDVKPDVLEEVRTGDLQTGDRIMVDGEPARVTNVTPDGRDVVVDVVYDKDGTADSIYADPDETVNRFTDDIGGEQPPEPPGSDEIGPADLKPGDLFDPGNGQKLRVVKNLGTVNGMPTYAITYTDEDGNENTLMWGRDVKLRRLPDEPPPPEPDLDPPSEEHAVSAGDVKVGDQIADTDGDPLTVIAVRKNRTTGLNDILTINSNGQRDTISLSDQVALARTREAIVPEDLLSGQRSGRAALATYQRRNLAILDLDHDESVDDMVRQAAARIRLKQEIGAGQSKALAAHLNELAINEPNARKQRSLQRLAGQVGAVEARLNGEDVPVVREADKMDKSTVGGVGEGDWIAVRAQGGGIEAQVGKVTGVRSLMGGRLREVSLIDSQGVESKRLLTPDTVAFVLPDLPDPQPIDEGLKPGPVKASEIARGDTVQVRDVIRGGMTEVRVDRIAPSDIGFSITGTRVVDGTSFGGQVAADAVVHRTQVNPARPIDHKDVQVGDVIDWADQDNRGKLKGFVTAIHDSPYGGEDPNTGKTIPVREVSVRDERGYVSTIILSDGDGSDLRLVTRDPEAAAAEQRRVDEERRREVITEVSGHLSKQASSAVRQVLRSANFQILLSDGPDDESGDVEHLRSKIQLNSFDKRELDGTRRRTASILARKLLTRDRDSDPAQQEALAKNLEGILKEAEDRAITNALKSIADTKPEDPRRETYGLARAEMARRMADPYNYASLPTTDADRAAARTLALASEALRKASVPDDGDTVPFDPALLASDTKGTVARAKAIIGGGGNFGKERSKVASFKPTSLADLEAGKVPEIITADVFLTSRAEDGGPGLVAMKHTQAVKDAGAAIRRDVTARVAERTANLPDLDALNTELVTAREARDAWTGEYRKREAALRDTLAKEKVGLGFEAIYDEIRKIEISRWGMQSGTPEREAADKRVLELRVARTAVDSELNGNAQWQADNAKYDKLSSKVREISSQIKTVGPQRRKALSDARREVLRELRDVGGGALAYNKGERAKATKAMRWAESYYPTDWLKAAATTQIDLKSVQRGYYNHGTATIALSGDNNEYVTSWINGTAIHELGHRMERQVPGLLDAEEAFLWSRTSTGEVGDRKREAKTRIYAGPKEVGWKDEFKEHYTGKDYGGQAYEVFTTGIESMFAGSPYADGDDDFTDFMMGVLATL